MDYYELTLQRKEQIESGLLELMETIPYAHITVTTLANHLGMSRKCFYNYFNSKEACFESLTKRMIQECVLFMENSTTDNRDDITIFSAILTFWKEHGNFYKALIQNDLSSYFSKMCLLWILEENKKLVADMSTESIPCDEDILIFYTTGQISMLLNWSHRDFDTSIQEMAQKWTRLSRLSMLPEK